MLVLPVLIHTVVVKFQSLQKLFSSLRLIENRITIYIISTVILKRNRISNTPKLYYKCQKPLGATLNRPLRSKMIFHITSALRSFYIKTLADKFNVFCFNKQTTHNDLNPQHDDSLIHQVLGL